MRIGELGEFELIQRLLRQAKSGSTQVTLGPGDDAAAVTPTPGFLIIATCDSQVEGRHFRIKSIGAEQLGRRLAAVNLSDIAAMGAGRDGHWRPLSSLPHSTSSIWRAAFVDSGRHWSSRKLELIGGNVAAGNTLILDLTLIGEVKPDELLKRSGAHPGDAILVTGDLGGLRGRTPRAGAGIKGFGSRRGDRGAPVATGAGRSGRVIAASGVATAAIDVSDGFAQDLTHICEASGVGVRIIRESLPIRAATREVAENLGIDHLDLALSGGEDYELVVTAELRGAIDLIERVRERTGTTLTQIGVVTDRSSGRWLASRGGGQRPFPSGGWQHFGAGSEPVDSSESGAPR